MRYRSLNLGEMTRKGPERRSREATYGLVPYEAALSFLNTRRRKASPGYSPRHKRAMSWNGIICSAAQPVFHNP